MINKVPFIVVDFETTGLEPRLDRIIEVAAVRVVDGKIVDEWDHLVNPGIFIPQESTNINGISTEMVETAPQFKEIAKQFMDFLGEDSVFVAHNVEFDFAFLSEHLKRLELPEFAPPLLCTFKLAKKLYPHLPKYSVGNLSKHFNIHLPQAHRALHDARASAELFNIFYKELRQSGLQNLEDFPTLQKAKTIGAPKNLNKQEQEDQMSLF